MKIHAFYIYENSCSFIKGEIDYISSSKTFNNFKGPGIFRPCASTFLNPTTTNCGQIDKIPITENSLSDEIKKTIKLRKFIINAQFKQMECISISKKDISLMMDLLNVLGQDEDTLTIGEVKRNLIMVYQNIS